MEKPAGQSVSSYGLKRAVLSGNETLAQSIALIAPTACPLLTVPLVYASAGTATWLTFVIATATIALVALNVNQFARISASPGSLYSYISAHMHPVVGMLAAWALLIAYIGTGTAIASGLTNYTNVLLKSLFGFQLFPMVVAIAGVGLAVWLAYRDVKISVRLMLGLEIISVVLISGVAVGVLARHGFHPDMEQVTLQGITPDKLRLGLVLAIFALVGFESATSLGSEAKDPLRNIPRAVKWSGILAGLFFIFCAYTEVLGFRGESETLDKSVAPLHVLARNAGLPTFLGILIDIGALVSFFSCVLACITAGARVLFLMGQKGALHSLLGKAHTSNRTPHRAVVVSGIAVFLPLGILTSIGFGASDIYGLSGTLATFGFLTAYVLVSLAAPIFLHAEGRLTARDVAISAMALLAMGLAFVGNIYPIPPPPYSYVPYFYLGFLLTGLAWSVVANARTPGFGEKLGTDLDAVAD
ncbi:MAG TPA: APC family permease [Bryobacteraceae bacterium]|jgi:amino acid transporter|nr:APC family permease [Bryobacteraceae bacterium]